MNTVSFTLKKALYSKSVLFRTCYTFVDRFYLFLDEKSDDEWEVTLKPKNDTKSGNPEECEGEFRNELITEGLREELLENTRKIKEIIVARALYGADDTSFIETASQQEYSDMEDEMDDYLEDPLGIAVPWEEKNKTDKE